MRGNKWLTLVFVSVICLSVVLPASAPPGKPTVVYVDPEESSVNPGDTVTVNVTVKDAINLEIYQIYLKFKPSVLQFRGLEFGPFLQGVGGYNLWWNYIGVTLGAYEPVSGNGMLFSLTFLVWEAGYSALDLFQSATNIPNTEFVDGYFQTTAHADLMRRGAWPEHRRFEVSKDEDATQTLSAKVENMGPTALFIKATFDLVRDDGFITTLTTEEVTTMPGEIILLTAHFGPLESADAAKYYVSARVQYTWARIAWADGVKTKTFSFSVTP